MLRCPEVHGGGIVQLGELRIGSGQRLAGHDKVDQFAPHRLRRPLHRHDAYRSPLLGGLKLRVGLALHTDLGSHVILGQADCLAHGPKPAARGFRCGRPHGVQGIDSSLEPPEDDLFDFGVN